MSEKQPRTSAEIEKWLCETMGDLLDVSPEEIQITTHFDSYSLDSSSAISITEMLGEYVGKSLEPTLLYDYPTIQSLAKHLTETR
ncbi:MAG TPA: acyl carrier protein [Kofleriaceae bacterium]|nr:acyl carrier protein [Kofleriaceae bacterium]